MDLLLPIMVDGKMVTRPMVVMLRSGVVFIAGLSRFLTVCLVKYATFFYCAGATVYAPLARNSVTSIGILGIGKLLYTRI
jgi:hypothetical protein